MIENKFVLVENPSKYCSLCGSNDNRRVAIPTLEEGEEEIILCSSCVHDAIDIMKIDTYG
jgi:hypothetical protein